MFNDFRAKCIFLALILFLYNSANAVRTYHPEIVDPLLEPWRWQNISELNGRIVECITQSFDGSLWFGTDSGVVKFDGIKWTRYSEEQGLLGQHVTAICAAKDGSIYAGTQIGISRFKDNSWQRIFPDRGALNFKIYDLEEFSDGSIWAAMVGSALCIKESRFTLYSAKAISDEIQRLAPSVQEIIDLPILRKNDFFSIFDVYEDHRGYIWFSSWFGSYLKGNGQLVRYAINAMRPEDPSVWKVYNESDGLEIGYNSKMLQTQNGILWCLSRRPDKGINRFDGKKWSHFSLHHMGGNDKNVSILETQDGTLWIGCQGKLCAFRNGRWSVYQYPQVPLPTTSYELFETASGDVWIIGRHGDIIRVNYSQTQWITYKNLNFQCETPDGRQWFIAKNGCVIAKEQNRFISYGSADGLINTAVALLVTPKGELWAAGSHNHKAAIAKFRKNRWTRKTFPRLSWGIDYRSAYSARDGMIWFGSSVDPITDQGFYGGVICYDPQKPKRHRWKQYTPPQVPETVLGITQTKNNSLWFGGEELVCFEKKQSLTAKKDIDPVLENVEFLTTTPNGQLWASSGSGGLYRIDENQYSQFSVQDNLASDLISSILVATDGTIWVGTNKGISHFDGQSWTKHALPPNITINIESGTLKQSLDEAIWVNLASREWYRRAFPGNNPNLSKIKYQTIRYLPEKRPPETMLSTIREKIPQPGNVILSWTGRDVQFMTPDNQIQYSYRMDGGKWSPFSIKTSEIFFCLEDGSHIFEVRARDRDFNVDPTPARVKFNVIPPLWKQYWFISLLAGFIFTIGIFEYRIIKRDTKLRREARYRSVIEDQSELICRFLPDGSLTFVNLAFCRFYHRSRQQLIGEKLGNLISEKTWHTLLNQLLNLSRKNPTLTCENRVQADDKIQWQQWIYRAIYNDENKFIEYQAVGIDITERKVNEKELKALNLKLRKLSAHLTRAREQESIRIARKIHDELGQVLTALKFDLFWLSKRVSNNKTQLDKIQSMIQIINASTTSVQKISQELRPKVLDDLGLRAAIDWQLNEFKGRTGIKTSLKSNVQSIRLDQERATALYRVFQETLTNIARHAQADTVTVHLHRKKDSLDLKVTDDGKGITSEELNNPESFGILSMQERVQFMQGNVDINGRQNKGTTVHVTIPLLSESQNSPKIEENIVN